MRQIASQKIYRIVDANFNRTKEGLRVCEDICRFVLDQSSFARSFKNIRHELTQCIASLKISIVIQARDIDGDVGRASTSLELKRKKMADVFYANSQRVKESMRVLEEVTKLLNTNLAVKIKQMRYKVYALEKKVTQQL